LGDLNQPNGKLDNNNELSIQLSEVEYDPPFLSRHSTFFKWCNLKFENYLDGKRKGDEVEITKLIYDRILELCHQYEIEVLITDVYGNSKFIKDYTTENKISFLDLSVDKNGKGNTNMPVDSHPSAKANKVYAEKLYAHLKDFHLE
jgi:hypothetical protein